MNITYEPYFNNKQILTDKNLGYGCRVDILARLEALLTDMTQRHCKVLFIRFDVRYPRGLLYPTDNVLFRGFMATFIKQYQRKNLGPAYLWVREQDSSDNHHYHCVLLLNGNKVQHYLPILRKADELWSLALGVEQQGLVHFCDSTVAGGKQANGLMIRRDKYAAPGVEERCFQWGSYLAKTNTKDDSLFNTRSIGCSRFPQGLYHQSIETYQQSLIP